MCASPLPLYQIAATCTRPCLNGGTCTAPDTCTCDVGWIGAQCETGTVHGLTRGHTVRCIKATIYQRKYQKHRGNTLTLRYTTTPLSIRLAGSTVCPLQCVAYITSVGHYRVNCKLYWRDCVDHMWEYLDPHSQQLGTMQELYKTPVRSLGHALGTNLFHTAFQAIPHHMPKCQEMCRPLHLDRA